jgi:alpha-L-fucosidase
MAYHSRSIYGCTQAPDEFITPANCLLTWNPATGRMYVHVLEWPIRSLHLPGFAGKFKYAQLLNDASEVHFRTQDGNATLVLPVLRPDVEVPVIELFME